MMTDPKILFDVQLPNTKTTAYTVPAGKAAFVSAISLVNTDAGAITINIYVKKSGGTSRRIAPKDYSLAAGARYADSLTMALAAGDIIEWDASTAAVVDGVIFGTEIMAQ